MFDWLEWRKQLSLDDEAEQQQAVEQGLSDWDIFEPPAEPEAETEPTSDPDEAAA